MKGSMILPFGGGDISTSNDKGAAGMEGSTQLGNELGLSCSNLTGSPYHLMPLTTVNSSGAGGGGGATSTLSISRRRKAGAPTMTLFVRSSKRSSDGEVDNSQSGRTGGASEEQGIGTSESNRNTSLVVAGDGSDRRDQASGRVRTSVGDTLSMAASGIGSVASAVPLSPNVLASNKPITLVFVVLLFFLLTFIFLLSTARQSIIQMTRVRVQNNEQGIATSISITEQLYSAIKEVRRLEADLAFATAVTAGPSVTSPRRMKSLEAAIAHWRSRVRALDALRDDAIQRLRIELGYRGRSEDVEFLVNEHVTYDQTLQVLAEEELDWLEAEQSRRRRRKQYISAVAVDGDHAASTMYPVDSDHGKAPAATPRDRESSGPPAATTSRDDASAEVEADSEEEELVPVVGHDGHVYYERYRSSQTWKAEEQLAAKGGRGPAYAGSTRGEPPEESRFLILRLLKYKLVAIPLILFLVSIYSRLM